MKKQTAMQNLITRSETVNKQSIIDKANEDYKILTRITIVGGISIRDLIILMNGINSNAEQLKLNLTIKSKKKSNKL
jgi:hypothetical protein